MSDRDFNAGVIYALEYLADIYEDIKYTNLWNDLTCTRCLELSSTLELVSTLEGETCWRCRNEE